MANINIIKGSSFLFQGEIKGLPTDAKLGSANVTASAEFYISGTYQKEGAAKVKVEKAQMNTSADDNTFSCYVDTASLGTGTLACAMTIEYPNPLGTGNIKEIIPVTINDPIKVNALS